MFSPPPPTPKHCLLMWATVQPTKLRVILTQLPSVSRTEGKRQGEAFPWGLHRDSHESGCLGLQPGLSPGTH